MALKKHLQIRRWSDINKGGKPSDLLSGEPFWVEKDSELYIGSGDGTDKYVNQDKITKLNLDIESAQNSLSSLEGKLKDANQGVYKNTDAWVLNGVNIINAINSVDSASTTKINADKVSLSTDVTLQGYYTSPWAYTIKKFDSSAWNADGAYKKNNVALTELDIDGLMNYNYLLNKPKIGYLLVGTSTSKKTETTPNITISTTAPTSSTPGESGDIWIQYI